MCPKLAHPFAIREALSFHMVNEGSPNPALEVADNALFLPIAEPGGFRARRTAQFLGAFGFGFSGVSTRLCFSQSALGSLTERFARGGGFSVTHHLQSCFQRPLK